MCRQNRLRPNDTNRSLGVSAVLSPEILQKQGVGCRKKFVNTSKGLPIFLWSANDALLNRGLYCQWRTFGINVCLEYE